MAHLLKAIQREHRKTGFGDSLRVHRRHSVLRSSKPNARRKYLVCAKGLRTRLDSMLDNNFSGRNPAERQTTPSPASGMEHYMHGKHKATPKGKRKAEYRHTTASGGAASQRSRGTLYIHQVQSTYIDIVLIQSVRSITDRFGRLSPLSCGKSWGRKIGAQRKFRLTCLGT